MQAKPNWEDSWAITFANDESELVYDTENDQIVVKAIVDNFEVNKILVDSGSVVDAIIYKAFISIGFKDEQLSPCELIYGFGNNRIPVKGLIKLPICLGDGRHVLSHMATFVVVDQPSPYNAIIGRPMMKITRMVEAVYCLKVKFPTSGGIGYMQTDQALARRCHLVSLVMSKQTAEANEEIEILQSSTNIGGHNHLLPHGRCNMELNMLEFYSPHDRNLLTLTYNGLDTLDTRDKHTLNKVEPVKQTLSIQLSTKEPSKTTQMGTRLSESEQERMIEFLRCNATSSHGR